MLTRFENRIDMRRWWNWYTRTLEVRMPYGLGVQVSLCAQKTEQSASTADFLLLCEAQAYREFRAIPSRGRGIFERWRENICDHKANQKTGQSRSFDFMLLLLLTVPLLLPLRSSVLERSSSDVGSPLLPSLGRSRASNDGLLNDGRLLSHR